MNTTTRAKTKQVIHEQLVADLKSAKQYSDSFREIPDGGSCNFDSVVIHPGRMRAAYTAALGNADIGYSPRRWLGVALFLHIGEGQGTRNTKMNEAFCAVLKAIGWPAMMYYRVD